MLKGSLECMHLNHLEGLAVTSQLNSMSLVMGPYYNAKVTAFEKQIPRPNPVLCW
jgi:hypothetical protein